MKKIKHPYYYVPPCPVCGSRCTGRFVRRPVKNSLYVEEESLKNGEIIRFCQGFPQDRVFCVDCGHEWEFRVLIKFLTREEISEEKKARGTEEAYEELLQMKEMEAPRRGGVFLWLFNSILSR